MEIITITVAAVFWTLILYFVIFQIISKATNADKLLKEQLRQSLYLEAIAKKLGVSEVEINAINDALEDKKKKWYFYYSNGCRLNSFVLSNK